MIWQRMFGGTTSGSTAGTNVTVEEAKRKLDAGEATLIDVREPNEWREGHVAGAKHIPLGQLTLHTAEIPRDREVLLLCRSGSRSALATQMLRQQGFEQARNVDGGVLAWTRRGYPLRSGS